MCPVGLVRGDAYFVPASSHLPTLCHLHAVRLDVLTALPSTHRARTITARFRAGGKQPSVAHSHGACLPLCGCRLTFSCTFIIASTDPTVNSRRSELFRVELVVDCFELALILMPPIFGPYLLILYHRLLHPVLAAGCGIFGKVSWSICVHS